MKYIILKNPSANAGDLRIADLIPGLERSPVAYWAPNAEFQRIARRDKKDFFSDQCKEIRKTIEWERLGISSRKSEIPKEHFIQR